mmetsp:Transcript_2185/g.3647  ORF Transcript_2185/g.3647 Transcript_2185/m.3647 type:complete len:103 (+) Transcript_2185:33-341(+)
MNIVGYFEIQSSNPERECKFYSSVFGWKIERDTNIPIEFYRITTDGVCGALLKRPAKVPGNEFGTNAFCCSILVENFDATSKKILDAGGVVALPKFAVPGRC